MTDISKLSLEEKIGQLIVCGFNGLEPDEHVRTLIEQYHVGNIIYFRRNVHDVKQICELSYQLQQMSWKQSPLPLIIAIDQEGGMVARIDNDEVTLIPGNMAIGATRDAGLAYEAALISGKELRQMGINVNFAPSVDINNNPLNPVIGVRSYGEQVELVSELGAVTISGYQEAGVAATAKHFPGHGDTAVDTHHGLASVPHDRERLMEMELAPFIRAIKDGVDAIMTAHVIFPAFEPNGIPATLSRKVLHDLLREELKYDGVIVTDCLEMHAISKVYGVAEGAVRAIEAGADLILVSHTLSEQVAAIEAMLAAVKSGRISEAQIDASVHRVIALKQKRHMEELSQITDDFAEEFGTPERKALVREISQRSITVVKDEGQLPLDVQEPTLVIWPEVRQRTEVDEPIVQAFTLGPALSGSLKAVKEVRISTYPTEEEIQSTLQLAENYKQIIVVTYNAVSVLHPGQVAIVSQLAEKNDVKLVVASTRNPYDLNQFPDIKTYICCYENRPLTMEALAKVLTGEIQSTGKLPVTISERYPFGASLN